MNLRLRAHELGQAEIQHLHSSVGGQEEVLGLEVPVDDVLGVGRLQAPCGLEHVRQDLLGRGRAPRDELSQRLPFEKLGDDVGCPLVGPHVVDGEDVRVIQGGDGARLALEEGEAGGVGGDLLRQDLDRHLATQARVASSVDLAHAAGADEIFDLVRPECAYRQTWSWGHRPAHTIVILRSPAGLRHNSHSEHG